MTDFYLFAISSLSIGLSRSGISALAAVSTPLLVFGLDSPKNAMAMAVVLFVMADIGALLYFRKKIVFPILLKIMPMTLVGILLAFIVGRYLSDRLILLLITLVSGITLLVLIWSGIRRNAVLQGAAQHAEDGAPSHSRLAHHTIMIFCGLMAGITTVLGNYASAFMNLYLFEMRLKKEQFIGTLAIFYFTINTIKLLAHIFYWQSLNIHHVVKLLPYWIFIIIGLIGGILVVKKLSEKIFTLVIVLSTLSSFVLLLVKIIA